MAEEMGSCKEAQGGLTVLGAGFSIQFPVEHFLGVCPTSMEVPFSLCHGRRAAYLRRPVPGCRSLPLRLPEPAGVASSARSSGGSGC